MPEDPTSSPLRMGRRGFLRIGLGTAVAAGFGPAFWRAAFAAPVESGVGPYGPLQAPDANGIMLPEGFSSRVVARAGTPVGTSGYTWHAFPDGGAVYPMEDGGWIYANNSEVPAPGGGGVGAVAFEADGEIRDAYRILEGTRMNCAGGPTPWGTWLSCEEYDGGGGNAGMVWECNPYEAGQGQAKPAMGKFQHEAVAVDPENQRLYLTEDQPDGRFYRFTPESYPSLDAGLLEVAGLDGDGLVTWFEVPDPSAASGTTRTQVAESTGFDGGEGCWYDAGFVYFTTKGTNRVWAHDIERNTIRTLYDASELDDPPLTGVDNVYVSSAGDLYVAEDGGNLEINIITADTREVTPVMRLTGTQHEGDGGTASSEITGPAFNPLGDRLYFNSQRGFGLGVTYEIQGPFRTERVGIAGLAVRDAQQTAYPPAPEDGTGESGDTRDGTGSTPATGAGLGAAAGLAAAAGAAALARRREDDRGEPGR